MGNGPRNVPIHVKIVTHHFLVHTILWWHVLDMCYPEPLHVLEHLQLMWACWVPTYGTFGMLKNGCEDCCERRLCYRKATNPRNSRKCVSWLDLTHLMKIIKLNRWGYNSQSRRSAIWSAILHMLTRELNSVGLTSGEACLWLHWKLTINTIYIWLCWKILTMTTAVVQFLFEPKRCRLWSRKNNNALHLSWT